MNRVDQFRQQVFEQYFTIFSLDAFTNLAIHDLFTYLFITHINQIVKSIDICDLVDIAYEALTLLADDFISFFGR